MNSFHQPCDLRGSFQDGIHDIFFHQGLRYEVSSHDISAWHLQIYRICLRNRTYQKKTMNFSWRSLKFKSTNPKPAGMMNNDPIMQVLFGIPDDAHRTSYGISWKVYRLWLRFQECSTRLIATLNGWQCNTHVLSVKTRSLDWNSRPEPPLLCKHPWLIHVGLWRVTNLLARKQQAIFVSLTSLSWMIFLLCLWANLPADLTRPSLVFTQIP